MCAALVECEKQKHKRIYDVIGVWTLCVWFFTKRECSVDACACVCVCMSMVCVNETHFNYMLEDSRHRDNIATFSSLYFIHAFMPHTTAAHEWMRVSVAFDEEIMYAKRPFQQTFRLHQSKSMRMQIGIEMKILEDINCRTAFHIMLSDRCAKVESASRVAHLDFAWCRICRLLWRLMHRNRIHGVSNEHCVRVCVSHRRYSWQTATINLTAAILWSMKLSEDAGAGADIREVGG